VSGDLGSLVVPVEAGATYQVDSWLLFGRPRFYQPDGSAGERRWLVADVEERLVAQIDGLSWRGRPARMSTVLLPSAWVVDGPDEDRPFETLLLVDGVDVDERVWWARLRWASRAQARAGHVAAVLLWRAHRRRLRGMHGAYRRRRRWW
jgi:hypothetical protein